MNRSTVVATVSVCLSVYFVIIGQIVETRRMKIAVGIRPFLPFLHLYVVTSRTLYIIICAERVNTEVANCIFQGVVEHL